MSLGQEPGTDAQIKEFCTKNYKVTFPMMSKVAVKGAKICPLYDYLTTKTEKQLQGPIDWNFAKFVVGRNGEVVARFKASVDPEDAKVVETIETELKEKVRRRAGVSTSRLNGDGERGVSTPRFTHAVIS
jgi:glutathione peroxidase